MLLVEFRRLVLRNQRADYRDKSDRDDDPDSERE